MNTIQTSKLVYGLRGVAGGVGVGTAMIASKFDAVLGGLLSVFPIISTVNLISLWLSHGEHFILGAIGPVILGNLSISTYAYTYSVLMPLLGPIFGAITAVLIAITLISLPTALLFRFLNQRDTLETSDSNEAEQEGLPLIDQPRVSNYSST